MTRLFLLEPETPEPVWTPFAGVRPVAELRAGAWLVRERWEASLGLRTGGIIGAHVEGFADVGTAPVIGPGAVEGPAVVARSDFVPARTALTLTPHRPRLLHHDRPVAWLVGPGARWDGPDTGAGTPIEGLALEGAWDLVTALERLLASDCLEFSAVEADPVPAGVIVLGDPARVVCLSAVVEPGVVFDVRQGAVVLAEGVEVRSGTRLEGPLYAGPRTRLLGGQLRHSAFGPECRVHGEVAGSVFTGFSNKSHDGFVGHSVLGQWVNLGAGTITSNLKNTYGDVYLELGDERRATGRQLLGSLIGDHAKTAIGTLLGTGTVVGAGANLFGSGPVPRQVPPLAWGLEGQKVDLEGFLRIAGRVLPRRGIPLTAELDTALRRLHQRLSR